MVTLLVDATSPTARSIQAAPGDWGIDAFVGCLDDGPVTVWQAKYFIDGVGETQKQQIRASFASVVASAERQGFALDRWILCIPVSMDGPTTRWWDRWRSRERDATGVTIELWDETALRARLMTEEGHDVHRTYYTWATAEGQGTPPAQGPPAPGDSAPRQPPDDPPAVPELRTRARRTLTLVAEVLTVIAVAIVVVGAVRSSLASGPDPRVLSADVGVVVAEFSTASGDEVPGISDLSLTFSQHLEEELVRRAAQPAADGSSLSAEVMSSNEVDALEAEPIEAMMARAEEVVTDHEADALVTATVSEDRRTVTPYLYLPATAVPDAPELAGLHPLGGAMTKRHPVDENVAARGSVRTELTERVGAIADVLVGLHRFGNGQYDDAEERFESALDQPPELIDHGIVLLFLGNTALKLDALDPGTRLDDAEERYQDGLAVEDTAVSARLELGLAEVAFHRNKGVCTADADRERALTQLRTQYQEVLASADPRLGDVFVDRARFGLARVEVCLATMGETSWDEAAGIYSDLAQRNQDGDEGKRDLAAESLAGLGYIASRGGVLWDEDLCADAAACYSRAAEVAIDPERQSAFKQRAAEHRGG